MNLNKEQKKAVEEVVGPLKIIAGPGSGKTKTIISKIQYLLLTKSVKPHEILVMTFTKRASLEIQERLLSLGESVKDVYTFHGWANRFVHDNKNSLKLEKYELISETQSRKMLSIAAKKTFKPNEFTKIFGYDQKEILSNSKLTLEVLKIKLWEYEKKYFSNSGIEVKNSKKFLLLKNYELLKRKKHLLDFEDLIIKSIDLLKTNKKIKQSYLNKYKYILVDEFQDTNIIQFELLKQLTSKSSNITFVGDPNQNIYGWRGANQDIFLNLSIFFPEIKIIKLKINYRSTRQIINVSNNLISNNKDDKLSPLISANENPPSSNSVHIIKKEDKKKLNKQVIKLISDLNKNHNIPLHDICVLSRNNYSIDIFIRDLLSSKILFRKIKSTPSEKKPLFSDLKKLFLLVLNPTIQTLIDFQNTLFVYENYRDLKNIDIYSKNYKEKTFSLTILLKTFDKQISRKTKKLIIKIILINRRETSNSEDLYLLLLTLVSETKFKNSIDVENRYLELESIVRGVIKKGGVFINDRTSNNLSYGKLNLSTIHSSKGMEFKIVIILDFNEGTLPSKKSLLNDYLLNEERRIAYVGITRAMSKLYLAFIENNDQKPSRFIMEMLLK